jgi:HEPN domain-containing protein
MSDIKAVKEWFDFAKDDIETAHWATETAYPPKLNIACYHCEQCSEKALKGYLVYKDYKYSHIHILEEICTTCATFDSSFTEILDDCTRLTPYGVIVRYPQEIFIDENLTKIALYQAQKIHDFCLSKIPELSNNTADEIKIVEGEK